MGLALSQMAAAWALQPEKEALTGRPAHTPARTPCASDLEERGVGTLAFG